MYFPESQIDNLKCSSDRARGGGGGGGHSGTEGAAPALRISRKKGSFF